MIEHFSLDAFVLSQCTRLTERQTDGRPAGGIDATRRNAKTEAWCASYNLCLVFWSFPCVAHDQINVVSSRSDGRCRFIFSENTAILAPSTNVMTYLLTWCDADRSWRTSTEKMKRGRRGRPVSIWSTSRSPMPSRSSLTWLTATSAICCRHYRHCNAKSERQFALLSWSLTLSKTSWKSTIGRRFWARSSFGIH